MLLDIHTHQPTAEGIIAPRSFAIHPWELEHPDTPETVAHLQRLTDLEEGIGVQEIDVVGECGIDRCRTTPIEVQTDMFLRHIRLARRIEKPLIIHCVHATEMLLQLRKAHPGGLWIFHGFTGSAETAQQLLRHSIIPSFGAAITDPQRVKVRCALQTTGLGNFFLETDTSPIPIRQVYETAANLLDISIDALAHDQLTRCPFKI